MTIAFVFLGFALGVILGSFAKAIADRSLSDKSFLGRSYCPACKKGLKWYDLVPIISSLYLQGKCRYCHKKFGIEYLVVEVLMGLLIGFLFFQIHFSVGTASPSDVLQFSILIFELIFKTFFITVLAILFLTDLKTMLIPDRVIIPAIIFSFISLTVISIYKVWFLYYGLSAHSVGKFLLPGYSDYFVRHAVLISQPLWGGVATGLAIAGFFLALIIITRGKGMGGGDVKLGAFLGLGLGFPGGILATVLSFLIGAIFSLIAIILGRKKFGDHLPFGPFLVLGSLIALFWGEQIINWYLTFSLIS